MVGGNRPDRVPACELGKSTDPVDHRAAALVGQLQPDVPAVRQDRRDAKVELAQIGPIGSRCLEHERVHRVLGAFERQPGRGQRARGAAWEVIRSEREVSARCEESRPSDVGRSGLLDLPRRQRRRPERVHRAARAARRAREVGAQCPALVEGGIIGPSPPAPAPVDGGVAGGVESRHGVVVGQRLLAPTNPTVRHQPNARVVREVRRGGKLQPHSFGVRVERQPVQRVLRALELERARPHRPFERRAADRGRAVARRLPARPGVHPCAQAEVGLLARVKRPDLCRQITVSGEDAHRERVAVREEVPPEELGDVVARILVGVPEIAVVAPVDGHRPAQGVAQLDPDLQRVAR